MSVTRVAIARGIKHNLPKEIASIIWVKKC